MGRGQDDAKLHDMGGNIGPADDSNQGGDLPETQGAHVTPEEIANALAVDSTPDQLRTGQWHQDETDIVVDSTGEVRDIDPDVAR